MRDNSIARPAATIVFAGVVAGALDITAAFVIWGLRGVAPTRVLQGVAAGLLGRASFQGGLPTALLGLGLHFFIATTAATIFYLAATRISLLTRRPVIAGVLYGIGIYLVMNLIVLPLSANKPRAFPPPGAVGLGITVIMVCVGLPIALIVARASGRTRRATGSLSANALGPGM
jgi:uncharacterized membrane protein YagU involved in acid resistance